MTHLSSIFSKRKRIVTLRVNTILSSLEEIENALKKVKIWYTIIDFPKNCFLIDENFSEPDLWKLDIYKQGKIYIQWISSQVPVHFFSSVWLENRSQQVRILDACAAPGGKTSQLAALYRDAEIYAFEPQKIRFEKMTHNLKKLWITNVICINDRVENIQRCIPEIDFFDMILVDAPCSGEGSISYHDTKFLENWSLNHIKRNYARQKAICDSVLPYLKTGWEMIYSTCTIAPEENEAVVHYLLCKYPNLVLENIDIINNKYIKYKEGLKSFEKYIFRKEMSECTIRVIPSEFSEGFYIAKIKKNVISNSPWSYI